MHDAEHEDHAVGLDDVVHDPVVPDPEAVKRVGNAVDRLDGLAGDPLRPVSGAGKVEQGIRDANPYLGWQLAQCLRSSRGDLDPVGGQSMSSRRTVRPLR